MKKLFMSLTFVSIVLCSTSLKAQEPYTPFPNSLSWSIWHTFYGFPGSFSIINEDTIINSNTYSKIAGNMQVIGIREDNKKIYAYFSSFGEQLLYDFNLNTGDTIFYHVSLAIHNAYPTTLSFRENEHYAVVKEKKTTTLSNSSVRNTMVLEGSEGNIVEWIEGIGATQKIGLLDPLHIDYLFDGGDDIQLSCICEQSDCLIWSDPGEIPHYMWCTCQPNKITEYQAGTITLFPNPTNGQLIINKGEVQIDNIELFYSYGSKHLLSPIKQQSQEITLDVSHLTNGIYFLKINTESGRQETIKFIKH